MALLLSLMTFNRSQEVFRRLDVFQFLSPIGQPWPLATLCTFSDLYAKKAAYSLKIRNKKNGNPQASIVLFYGFLAWVCLVASPCNLYN